MQKEMVYVENGNLDNGDLVTNSYIISENAGITHKAVKNQISKRKENIEMFGKLTVLIIPSEKGTQFNETYYELNEGQATLLFTFLQNTERVIEFKIKLVRAFFSMRDELLKRKETRDIAKIDRENLTRMICESGEQERMHNKGIPTYTNLIYKSVFGVDKKNLIISRGFEYKKDINLREFLNEEEIEKVRKVEATVSGLLSLNYDYGQIKNILKVK